MPKRVVGGYEDPDLWTVFEQICVAELTQAVHRNRVLLHEDHVAWVFSPMPMMDTQVDWIADDPPLMPGRWLEGKFEAENPIPFDRWLDLLEWGIWERLEDEEKLTSETLAEGIGVSHSHVSSEKWIDGLAMAYPDLFEATAIKLNKRGRPPIALGAK